MMLAMCLRVSPVMRCDLFLERISKKNVFLQDDEWMKKGFSPCVPSHCTLVCKTFMSRLESCGWEGLRV